jgi:hypothetical protein
MAWLLIMAAGAAALGVLVPVIIFWLTREGDDSD